MDNAESIVESYFKFLDRDGSGITSAQPTFTVNTRSQAFTSKLLLVDSASLQHPRSAYSYNQQTDLCKNVLTVNAADRFS